jgi:hypothetical protein
MTRSRDEHLLLKSKAGKLHLAREDDPEASVCGRPTNGPLVNVTLGRRETFGEFVARIGHSVSVCGTCKRKAGP